MKDEIVTLRRGAEDCYKEETLWVRLGEEGFLLTPSGDLLTLLPGRHRLPAGGRAVALRSGAPYVGVAGAGDVPAPGGGTLGGWVRFRCALISPRRFAARCGEALLGGASAGALLTEAVRRALEEGLRGGAEAPAARWRRCREAARQNLLERGWQLTAFRPERLERGGEVSA